MKKIGASFVLSFLALIIGTAHFPQINIFYFAPFLVIITLRLPFNKAIWISALTGLLMDLLNSSHHFGSYALCYTLAVVLLFTQKRYLNDKAVNLALYTFVFSAVTSFFLIMSSFIFDKGLTSNFLSLITNITVMPLVDSLYAVIWFTIPFEGYMLAKKFMKRFMQGKQWIRFRYFLKKLRRLRFR